ncbi:unnamed protein product [Sphenostylis stenocarpa]|uniref:Uncharacterized protein n=1 Tax=Sphenostylis stenocarpa TaxID=92480 RepID=A0AA86W0V9_9FABA|nr:unnamed protein product [Sphenostylis stenocarpa]
MFPEGLIAFAKFKSFNQLSTNANKKKRDPYLVASINQRKLCSPRGIHVTIAGRIDGENATFIDVVSVNGTETWSRSVFSRGFRNIEEAVKTNWGRKVFGEVQEGLCPEHRRRSEVVPAGDSEVRGRCHQKHALNSG